jgi:predicted membrane chloride channel (bestrophin family)
MLCIFLCFVPCLKVSFQLPFFPLKMALCNFWLKEFVSRETLHGSTGNVHEPLIGRIYQFVSDGVTGYNQCRKIAFVPFPFPNAQMTVFFAFVIIFVFPLLFFSFLNNIVFGCVMNFTTVLCFLGVHEVARELENPYYAVPNDLPLNHFQTEFNEALITMYAGFHPDCFRKEENPKKSDVPNAEEEKEGADVPNST